MLHKNYYACFGCRKVFARRAYWEPIETDYIDHRGRKKARKGHRPHAKATCAECGGHLYVMGRRFKAPKRNDVTTWRKIERLRLSGVRFGYGRIPLKAWEVEAYLQKRDQQARKSEGERLLDNIKRKSGE